MSIVYTLSMLVCLGADPKPPPPALALEKQITVAVTDALEARGEVFRKLAVVSVADDRSATALEAPKTLAALRDLLDEVTVQSKRQVIDRDQFDTACKQLDLTGSLKPSDVARLRKQFEFDGVISATWSQRNERQTIRIALLAPDRVVWSKTLTAKSGDEVAAVRKAKPAPNGNAARGQRDGVVNGQQANGGVANAAGAGGYPGIIGSGGFLPIGGGAGAVTTAGSKPSDASRTSTADGAAKSTAGSDAQAKKSTDAGQNSTNGGTAKGSPASSNADSKSSSANDSRNSGPASNSGSGSGSASNVPELNRKVLEFATNHLGQQVGNGECWTLAAEALIYAKAQTARGYTFGRELGGAEKPMVGDIMQFTSCRFQDRNFTAIMGVPNHTAIIYAVEGNKLTFIHQNFGTRTVTLLTLDMTTRTSGSSLTYRPQPRESETTQERAQ
ncbi:MAG: CHAP domain-containing protein [Planctomycetales bacterium]|nr:CHAP domain-containing protein [Planctomycetales bacterium]